jgi:hypothetical protein
MDWIYLCICSFGDYLIWFNVICFIRPETPEDIRARRHYSFAKVDGVMFELYDNAYVKVSLCESTD